VFDLAETAVVDVGANARNPEGIFTMNKTAAVTARQLWPTLELLELWVSRNCPSCRFLNHLNPNAPGTADCIVPRNALICHLKDLPMSIPDCHVLLEPPGTAVALWTGQAPRMCRSRMDKRGRSKSF
jgi:hypothetical protein